MMHHVLMLLYLTSSHFSSNILALINSVIHLVSVRIISIEFKQWHLLILEYECSLLVYPFIKST